MLSRRLAEAVRWACELELKAMKPGNVGVHAPGHGMTVEHFLASAEAACVPLAAPRATVGQRILEAVKATRAAVGCNTNLGIVLLAAPIVHAALLAPGAGRLRETLQAVLAGLTVEDASLAYEAIRLAQPGGLGESPRHDVREPPRVTLLEAMREAGSRDSIARQYAGGFADVFEHGVPLLRGFRQRWGSDEWAAAAVYLDFLARIPDTLITRKFGREAAERVSREAAPLAAALAGAQIPQEFSGPMLEFDSRLKHDGLNPGSSADLTVATLLAVRSEEVLEEVFGRGAGSGPRRQSTWDASRAFSPLTEKET